MNMRLKLLALSAGALFFLGLGAACSGKPIKLTLTMPDSSLVVEVNPPNIKKNIPFLNPGDVHLIASLPVSESR